jgi:RNA polymerase sigma-70 factor (ECF subfamily)
VSEDVTGLVARERTGVMEDFGVFYAAAFPRLVGYLSPIVGGRQEAEDLAQEAFVRLVPRWERVQAYEDPEAWLRSVGFRLAVSRWRRLRVSARHLARQAKVPLVDAPDEDMLRVGEVLGPLSLEHRQVLVLHHALGFSVEEIARELGVAPGTVKSRLSRARVAAALLADSDRGGADE